MYKYINCLLVIHMKKKKIYFSKLKLIIVSSVMGTVILALVITNFFIPVKYLTAYFHFKKYGNPQGQMRVSYLDVGYGDCTLVELPDGKVMLIDGGTGAYANVYKLLNTLNRKGIKAIDYLFCTSVKSEHCGALAQLVKYKTVENAYIPYVTNINLTDEYADFYKQLLKSGASVEIAEYGKGVYNAADNYFFGVLSPSVLSSSGSEYADMNAKPTALNIDNASVVIWLQYAGTSFMFLSDAGKDVQTKIADSLLLEDGRVLVDGNEVSLSYCNVIKASNHGSSNYTHSALYGLLLHADKSAAIVSVGKNAKSSPSNIEINFIKQYVGDNLYRTDKDGTVTVTVTAHDYKISKEKK